MTNPTTARRSAPQTQTAILMADFALYRLFENLPYEALAGCTVGRALAPAGEAAAS
jgi:hypothetical protein